MVRERGQGRGTDRFVSRLLDAVLAERRVLPLSTCRSGQFYDVMFSAVFPQVF